MCRFPLQNGNSPTFISDGGRKKYFANDYSAIQIGIIDYMKRAAPGCDIHPGRNHQ
jgi:hypothetical protein